MKITLRMQSMLLVIPFVIALAILVVTAMIPYVLVHQDIARIEQDLDATLAILEFGATVTEQSREYADLLVTGSEDDVDEVRRAHGEARQAFVEWQEAAGATIRDESAAVRRIEAEHAAVTAAGDRIIDLNRRGRPREATNILMREVRPRTKLILQLTLDALLQREQDISRSLDRISGGILYSGFLGFGNLQEGVAELDAHVAKTLQSARLRNVLEASIATYWEFYLTADPSLRFEDAAFRSRAETFFTTWRSAILKDAGEHADLTTLETTHRNHRSLQARGERVFELVAAGADAEAKTILVEEMEFEETPTARGLKIYIFRETEAVRRDLAFLREETARVRTILALLGVVMLLIAFGVPLHFSRRMIAPIVNLQVAAERIGRGDFDTRVRVPAVKELGALAVTFNTMTDELETSRENLRRSQERFALAARATSDVIWDLDMATQAGQVNGSLASEYGFSESEPALVENWIARIHADDRERVSREFADAIAGSANLMAFEYRYLRANGTYAHIIDRAYIVRDDGDVPIRLIGAMSDVTEQKIAEQTVAALSRQNEMILDSVGEGILGGDRNGNIISANPAAAAMLGLDPDDLLGRNLRDLFDPGAPDEAGFRWEESPIAATLQRGTRETSDSFRFMHADGSKFPADFTSNPMVDENCQIIGAVVAFRDITQKHDVDRLKSQFVSTVSHELRTPLTSMRGSLGLLASGLVGNVSPKAQRMLEIAVSNTDRLVRLINDILDIERLESGALVPALRPIDVTDLMQQAMEVMKPMADKAGVALLCAPFPGTIRADQDRMMQTLTNLLSNAIKFSLPATTITLSADRAGSMLRFRVADQGRGIPADKLERVFERFQQVDASDSRDKGGTGLGLSICRSIVQQHGGKIWVESVLGHGSTFYFTVPLAEAERAGDPAIALGAEATA